ncbi:unnamed protein product, partial [Rotaria sp. Silwood2]
MERYRPNGLIILPNDTLNDAHFILPLIHDLEQIVSIYIYSATPDKVNYKISDYSKLYAIVQEDLPNANEQLLADIEIFKQDLLPVNVSNPIIGETQLFTKDTSNEQDHSVIQIQNDEESDLQVVWIQDDDYKNMVNMLSVKERIKSFKIYINIEECVNYIRSLTNVVQLFVILSKLNNDLSIQIIINLINIRFIYISSLRKEVANKIRGIYLNIDDLCDQLLRDYSRALKMSVSIFNKDKKEKTVRNLHEDNARLVWLPVLVDNRVQI